MKLHCEVFNPDAVTRARAAVIIPACNEAERIGACLDSLEAQARQEGCALNICVNNTEDETAAIVRARARRHGIALVLSDLRLPRGGVGRARRLGHLLAMRHSPRAEALLSTDADCQAAPGWIAAMRAALRTDPAALGRIEGLDDLPPDLLARLHQSGRVEDDYMRLSMEFARLVSGDGPGALGLNTAGGANLGLRRDVYRAIGGFRPLPSREDRDIVDRLLAAGHRPARVEAALVRASMRPDGRAPGGMADKLAARLSGGAAALDSALAPVKAMLARYSGGNLVPRAPFSAAQAERDLPILAEHVEALRRIGCPDARQRYLTASRWRD